MDLRIVKTHQVIRAAFIKLLTLYDYEAITIQNIIEEAKVNRATFYKYYQGKSDLTGQMIDDFKQEMNKMFAARLVSDTQDLQNLMENHGQNLFALRKQMLALFKIRTKRHNLYQDVFDMAKQNFIELAQLRLNHDLQSVKNLDYQANMMATMMLASCQYYFVKDMPLPKELTQDWQQMIDIVKIH